MPFHTTDPTTGRTEQTFDVLDREGVDAAISRAHDAFAGFRNTPVTVRAETLRNVAEQLEGRRDELARLAMKEMGKPIAEAGGEVDKCAWVCRYYAEHAEEQLAAESVETEAKASYVRHLPLGVVLAIMPWNFPYWQILRFAAPALAAGNTALVKPAPSTPRCGLAVAEMFADAGFPEGCLQTILVEPEQVPSILDDPRVRAVTLTGSEAAGSAVAEQAAKRIKPSVLELGGSDPFVVMPSADLDRALDAAVTSRMINNGQSCIAAKRFVVHEDVADAFTEGLVERVEALQLGDPSDEDTDIGPIATAALRDRLADQVDRSIEAGARALTGCEIVEGEGFFYRPGVLTDVPEDCPARTEELFGPVAVVHRARDLVHAIALANETRYGLGATIFTQDDTEAERAIRDLDAGCTFVNAFVKSDPRLPFGGTKASGYGRELARDGLLSFVNRKTVWVEG